MDGRRSIRERINIASGSVMRQSQVGDDLQRRSKQLEMEVGGPARLGFAPVVVAPRRPCSQYVDRAVDAAHGRPRTCTRDRTRLNDFLNLELVSKGVGYATLAGSLLYKVPQVWRVLEKRSGEGISLSGLALETTGTVTGAIYSLRCRFPFSTFGESLFIPVQNWAIMALCIFYERAPALPWFAWFFLLLGSALLLLLPQCPMALLTTLNLAGTPIMLSSRVPQLHMNWRNKSTGQLAPITLALQLLGNIARLFTTLVQVRDPVVLFGFLSATCLNGTLFFQWWYYRGKSPSRPVTGNP